MLIFSYLELLIQVALCSVQGTETPRLAPFTFTDLEQSRHWKKFLVEDLVASFICLELKLLVAVVLEAILLFVEMSDADAVGDKANDFREF